MPARGRTRARRLHRRRGRPWKPDPGRAQRPRIGRGRSLAVEPSDQALPAGQSGICGISPASSGRAAILPRECTRASGLIPSSRRRLAGSTWACGKARAPRTRPGRPAAGWCGGDQPRHCAGWCGQDAHRDDQVIVDEATRGLDLHYDWVRCAWIGLLCLGFCLLHRRIMGFLEHKTNSCGWSMSIPVWT